MHNLIVLDYAAGEVYLYHIESGLQSEEVEEFISERHRLNDCHWMSTPDGSAMKINKEE
jgi:hypothetical protein